ncbi:hypothetical protein AAHC03_05528 [Spirometra sp. Aus1]
MCIYEPPLSHSGLPQGTLLRRQRVPKNDVGDHYIWKELNIGQNLTVYGRVYRIINCDEFTKNFFESEGLELNEPEKAPEDPYLTKRAIREAIALNTTPSSFDKRRQHLELDRQVLRFYAAWDDRDEMFGELRKFVIHYYLMDDTLEVREKHERNDGRDPFSVLIRRERIPKDRDAVPPTFPSVCLELTENEIKEYFTPKDLRIGNTIVIFGRAFLIYDCDNFTKAWYYQNFGLTEFKPVPVDPPKKEITKMELPFYNGYGTLEDSLASSKTFMPKPPKVDFEKQVDYSAKVLRYEVKLDSVRPDDALRRFILSYRLADDMISIYEVGLRNTGFPGGYFLRRSRVAKPGSTAEQPRYYGPADFELGAIIDVFGTRFVIMDADEYVIKFMDVNRDQFEDKLIEGLRAKVVDQLMHSEEVQKAKRSSKKCGPADIQRTAGDLDKMVEELEVQFGKLALTDSSRIDGMFLKYNKDRLTYVDLINLKDMCKKLQLPGDEDVLNAFLDKHGCEGRMTLDQFRKFFEKAPAAGCS